MQPIGVTRFCEQPDLLAVGGTKDPDVERIVGLRPDLVVVNDEENRIEDVDALYAHARAQGLEPTTLPRDAEWGERFFHLTDPDGHELSFAKPLDDRRGLASDLVGSPP